MRFLFIFMVIAIYQGLNYGFGRSLLWLYGANWSKAGRRWLWALIFTLANGLVAFTLLAPLGWPIFLFTSATVLLWFWCLTTLALWLPRLGKPWPAAKFLQPLLFVALTAYGYFNATQPTVVRYEISLPKQFNDFTIALVADSHFGPFISRDMVGKYREIIERERPDIILHAGDVINDTPYYYLKDGLDQLLREVRAPWGQWAILGNHEYYGVRSDHPASAEMNGAAIERGGFHLLRDATASLGPLFILGRDDYSNPERRPLEDWRDELEKHKDKVVILLDHQPRQLREKAQLPIDISLSGHTHRGQVFPANIFTHFIYELDYGHREINGTHFFVTSGLGLWGPPLRLGSRSEVVLIHVKSQPQR